MLQLGQVITDKTDKFHVNINIGPRFVILFANNLSQEKGVTIISKGTWYGPYKLYNLWFNFKWLFSWVGPTVVSFPILKYFILLNIFMWTSSGSKLRQNRDTFN